MNKSRKIFFIIIILQFFKFSFSFAQEPETINTDRPDQSDGAYILTEKFLQIENGITTLNGLFVNNLMLRYGLTNSTEVRLVLDYGKVNNNFGLLPIGFSVKQNIIKEENIIPDITLVAYLRNEELASSDFRKKNYSYSMLLAFQNTITDEIGVGYNISTSNIKENIGFTTSIGYSINNSLTTFVEYFSQFNTSQIPQHNIDFGLLYLANHNLQFDVAFGKSLTSTNNLIHLTSGICYKFKLHD